MVFEIIDEPYRKNPRVNVEGKRLSRAFVAECERAFALYNDFLITYGVFMHDNSGKVKIPEHIGNQQRDKARRMRNNAQIIKNKLNELYEQRDKFDQQALLSRISFEWPKKSWYDEIGLERTIEPILELYDASNVKNSSSFETQDTFYDIVRVVKGKASGYLNIILLMDVSAINNPNYLRTTPSRGLLKKGSGKTTGVKKTAKPRKRITSTKSVATKRVTDVAGQFKKITGFKL
jgi:hypothetical protein